MSIRIVKNLIVTIVLGAFLSGCVGMGGPSAEEEVQAAIEAFHVTQIAGDIDGMMASFSDNYSNSQGADKSAVAGFLGAAASQGFFKDMKINDESSVMTVDGENASVGPIIYTTPLGPLTLRYRLKKEEDGVWRFIDTEQSN